MADGLYRRSECCMHVLKYRRVWRSKFRRLVLTETAASDRKRLLHAKARELGVSIEALEIMPYHVHLFVSADPTDAPQRLANQFKGYTSRWLRDKHPHLRSRLPSLWSRSYYVGSVGQVSEATVKHYIGAQKGK